MEKSSTTLSLSASDRLGALKAQDKFWSYCECMVECRKRFRRRRSIEFSKKSGVNPSSSAGTPQRVMDKNWPNNFKIEQVYSNLRQRIGRQPGDEMLDLNVTLLIWRMFMSATTGAAVHFGQDFQDVGLITDSSRLIVVYWVKNIMVAERCFVFCVCKHGS